MKVAFNTLLPSIDTGMGLADPDRSPLHPEKTQPDEAVAKTHMVVPGLYVFVPTPGFVEPDPLGD